MSVRFDIGFKKCGGLQANKTAIEKKGISLKGDNGCSVILVHGLTGTPQEMSYLAKFLHNKGYSVFCPLLANHGEPIQILKNTKWQDCYQSVKDVFINIISTQNTDLVFAAGLSIGALLVLLLADEFQGKVSAVSCLSPTLFYDGWNMPWSRHLLPLAYITPLKNWFYFKEESPYGLKNEALRRLVHEYYRNAQLQDTSGFVPYGYPYIPVSLMYQNHLLVKYLKKRLMYITVPVQLIQAKEDDMTSIKNSQYIYNRIKSEVKDMVLLYDSYHVITADQERDKVAQEMDRFFNHISSDLSSNYKASQGNLKYA